MGLIKELALAPVAPLRLTLWVAEKVAEETERQQHSPEAVLSQLREIQAAAERGEISEQEAREREGRIIASRMRSAGAQGVGVPPPTPSEEADAQLSTHAEGGDG